MAKNWQKCYWSEKHGFDNMQGREVRHRKKIAHVFAYVWKLTSCVKYDLSYGPRV